MLVKSRYPHVSTFTYVPLEPRYPHADLEPKHPQAGLLLTIPQQALNYLKQFAHRGTENAHLPRTAS